MRHQMLRAAGRKVEFIDSATHTDTSADWSMNISGASFNTGDVGVLVLAGETADSAYTIPGWTEISPSGVSGGEHAIFTRTMVGTDTTIASSAFSSSATAIVVGFFRNCYEPTAAEVTKDQRTVVVATPPNSPAAAYAVTDSDLVLTTAASEGKGPTTAVPSGYTEVETVNYNDTKYMCASMAYIRTTGTPDPGSFTDTNSGIWTANTLVLQLS